MKRQATMLDTLENAERVILDVLPSVGNDGLQNCRRLKNLLIDLPVLIRKLRADPELLQRIEQTISSPAPNVNRDGENHA